MPELPEVETTRRGIEPLICGKTIRDVRIRQSSLRQPVTPELVTYLTGMRFKAVYRRAKYLLLATEAGSVLVHLGMSGSLRVVSDDTPPQKHDHVDIVFSDGTCLRYRDARRFGLILWAGSHPLEHELLTHLGPEPLSDELDGDWLYQKAQGRRVAVKAFLMDQRVVVGVGNIYASEALFRAGIHPERAAGRISQRRYQRLAAAVKAVLIESIAEGGTTLRDFTGADGAPGYFRMALKVYGRTGQACPECGQAVQSRLIGQRSSFFCSRCQR